MNICMAFSKQKQLKSNSSILVERRKRTGVNIAKTRKFPRRGMDRSQTCDDELSGTTEEKKWLENSRLRFDFDKSSQKSPPLHKNSRQK
ncbi:hypothetical protein PoB_004329900 [Plakobranchus ocellatus]|uniref:Uncharacterized protein n=1 Tax=Plakobranchus ocellatus TaxID=259542 RepID=A0AAV4BDB3_9GAST|nr:hypothetical protein PoB_004329900 [Plakobranchus ocellatus]